MNSKANTLNSLEKKLLQFPAPDQDAQQHSQLLINRIIEEMVRHDGRISFEKYMSMALTAPGLGYYVSGNRKLGADGDFVTAPEISPLFSRCVARQSAQVLSSLQTNGNANMLEFGAGSGVMAADILLELEQLKVLPERYFILEISAELRQRQLQTIQRMAAHLSDRVTWLDRLPDNGFRGVVLANEVLDAMPVHRFYKDKDQLGEYYVAWEGQRFVWERHQFSDPQVASRVCELSEKLPDCYSSEINLAMNAWIASVSEFLQQGIVLIIDYGFPQHEYYHEQRQQGTLMCHYRHRSHDNPLLYPGLQDITAHVNFTALAEAADAVNLHVAGYNSQAFFLIANGLENMMLAGDMNDPAYIKQAQQVKKLTMPGEMGELFKVMALTREFNTALQGFQLQDLKSRL